MGNRGQGNPEVPAGGEGTHSLRLFFALWPNARVQAGLDHAAERLEALCGGRRTPTEKIHLTLTFLGEMEATRLDALRSAAAEVKGPAFDLNFSKLGWWRHNRVAWAAPEEVPPALALLVNNLRSALRQAGFPFDQKACLPHATLLRKANCRELAALSEPIPWRVDEFVLVRSRLDRSGSEYEIVGRWPLTAD